MLGLYLLFQMRAVLKRMVAYTILQAALALLLICLIFNVSP